MKWKPFFYKSDILYDLSHLHPCECIYYQPAKGNKPGRKYSVNITFGMHCFTRSVDGENQRGLFYSDNQETRIFDFRRYKLSFYLPGIIKTLDQRECFHTNHKNYFTIEVINDEGQKVDYEVYFEVKKVKGSLELFINSAYPRDPERIINRPKKKKIRFYVILYNILHNKRIRKPS